ncbi:22601_t:CDS:1 [Gigaspora rosea]|nr:22601_t:CDS:1 [Gigaspora rosea]
MNEDSSISGIIDIETGGKEATFTKKYPVHIEHSLTFDNLSINTINISDSTESVFSLHLHTINKLIRFFNIMLMIILILLESMLIMRNYSFFKDISDNISEIFLPTSLSIQIILAILEFISICNTLIRCKSGIRTITLCAIGFLTYFILAVMNILMIPPDIFCYNQNNMQSCNLFSAILVLTWIPVGCYLLVMGLSTSEWWERKLRRN